ncbi:hypothetical protein F5887DRAFT_529516 [Amanita rubescens]|nr:hypothetical protein F5887DRAFT_529516 [Amanita rubescens]
MSVTTLASPSLPPVTFLPVQDGLDSADVRMVRFDDECILIPEQNRKRSRVVTKSYALPLWKRRSQLSDTESTDGAPSPVIPSTLEDAHIVIKVPLPSFIIRGSRSPNRARSPSPRAPLSPCLVHRASSTPTSPVCQKPDPALRRPSSPTYHKRKSNSTVTVPLRACCPNCVRITEECMREGEHWKVKFTRGAKRRRSTSLDSNGPRPSSRDGASFSDDMASLPRLTISVDEVDKRRRSLDSKEDTRRHQVPPHPSHTNSDPSSSALLSTSGCNRDSSTRNLAPMLAPHPPARSSPIQEEDEDQLFPLPSPRRTPSSSPSSSLNIDLSPKASPSHSRSSSARSTPAPSPNPSISCFDSTSRKSGTSFDDSILSQSISRKNNRFEEPATNSASELPNLVLNERTNVPYTPSTSVRSLASTSAVPSRSPSISASPNASPSLPRRVVSMPSPGRKSKKPSFSFLKAGADALKGAGADVLKGVGMGGSMHHLG